MSLADAVQPGSPASNPGHNQAGDTRYQRWDGKFDQGHWTWLTIVTVGVRRALAKGKTRSLVMTGFGFVVGSCLFFYMFSFLESLAMSEAFSQYEALFEMSKALLGIDLTGIDISGAGRLSEYRELLWRATFLLMIKVQMFWVLIIVARVGPGLIANDIKSCALPIYFAKPVTPITYVLGKWLIVASFIAMVLLPNLASLIIGTLITGGLEPFSHTLDLGLDLLIVGLAMCVVGGAIMLAFSSMTSDYRYAAIGWLAVCVLLAIGQGILNDQLPGEATRSWLGCVSLRDNFVVLTDYLFGMREAWSASSLPEIAYTEALVRPVRPMCAIVVLAGWTILALLVCYRRVLRFSRSAANV